MNNKGFVVSAVLYPLLVLFLALIMGLISMSSTRKNILDNMKMEITDSIFDSVTCDCEEINNTLKNYGQDIKNIENDITSIKGQISTINTTQNTFRTDLTNLTGRVNSLETNLTNLTNNYEESTGLLDNKIENLAKVVSTINTNLTNLTNRVNTLAQQELAIYMSPSGNDSNDGLTESTPMLTLNAVLNKYSNPSLELILDYGTYDWGNVEIYNRTIVIHRKSYPSWSYNEIFKTYGNATDRCSEYDDSTWTGSCQATINTGWLKVYNSNLSLYFVGLITSEKVRIFPNGIDITGKRPEFYDNEIKDELSVPDLNNFAATTENPSFWLENSSLYLYESYHQSKLSDVSGGIYASGSIIRSKEGNFYGVNNAITLANNSNAYIYEASLTSTTGDDDKAGATLKVDKTSRAVIDGAVNAQSASNFYLWNQGSVKITGTKTGKTATYNYYG